MSDFKDSTEVLNFRSIGGIIALDGRQIRHETIYRSGNPHASSFGQVLVKSLALKLVVDLRSLEGGTGQGLDGSQAGNDQTREAGAHGRREANASRRPQYLNIALGYKRAGLWQRLAMLRQGGMQRLYDREMTHNYRGLAVEGHARLRQFFKRLCHADSYPLLIHCQHGKDRTGFVIALLMKLLGVSDEEIENEFLRSRPPPSIYHGIFNHERHKHAYLQAAMDEVISIYGTWPTFFEAGLRLRPHEQQMIRSLVLV